MLERAGYRHYDIEPMLPKLSATIVGRVARMERQRNPGIGLAVSTRTTDCAPLALQPGYGG
jgi:hypothetical protein